MRVVGASSMGRLLPAAAAVKTEAHTGTTPQPPTCSVASRTELLKTSSWRSATLGTPNLA